MAKELFREKSIERISSPDQLNDYIRVTNPGVWLLLTTIIIALMSFCIWGIIGHIDTTVDTVCVVQSGRGICYVDDKSIGHISDGMTVTINGSDYKITAISHSPKQLSGADKEYIIEKLNINENDNIYELSVSTELPDGIYSGSIVVNVVKPITYVTN